MPSVVPDDAPTVAPRVVLPVGAQVGREGGTAASGCGMYHVRPVVIPIAMLARRDRRVIGL